MAIDSRQKRMSAIAVSSPWRGGLVDASEAGFTQGNRQAADFMYSGILAEPPAEAYLERRMTDWAQRLGSRSAWPRVQGI